MREGICSTLLEQVNSRMWPPTLRDMAAGHLQFLMVRCLSLDVRFKHAFSANAFCLGMYMSTTQELLLSVRLKWLLAVCVCVCFGA